MTTYFSFAMSDTMFSACGESRTLVRQAISAAKAAEIVAKGVVSCVNPSHRPTITAAWQRFGIALEVPERAPQVSLRPGDELVVMQVNGLPRLGADRHEYTEAEIASAVFTFARWMVYSDEEEERLAIMYYHS